MKVDIHFTTCHHTEVKCRPRPNNGYPGFNIESWTHEDKLNIAKTSLQSLIDFCEVIPDYDLTVIDDGSNIAEARDWLNNLSGVNVLSFPHRGSAYGINDYFSKDNNADLICHFEDDHIFYNPEKLNWAQIAYEFLIENPNVGVITLRSGLPSDASDPGYFGKWGPKGFTEKAILYHAMGNAHHIMLPRTYFKFLPLQGNTGGCEEYMNQRLSQLGLMNVELQIPVYAFHSHTWSRELPNPITTKDLNMTGRGIEYGIKEMYEHIKNNKAIKYNYYKLTEEVVKC